MESTAEDRVDSKFIIKIGEGMHHISLKVKDIVGLINS